MKLKDDFFKIKNLSQTASGMDYAIELNPKHTIFGAHFPNNPITPGVCIIQIVKELSEDMLKCELFLKEAKNIKFLNVIDPLMNPKITFSISITSESEDEHKIAAVVYTHNQQFAKLSMIYKMNNE